MFSGCGFQLNVCGTFKSHKNRNHNPHSLSDFKSGVVTISGTAGQEFSSDIEGIHSRVGPVAIVQVASTQTASETFPCHLQ